MAKVSSKKKRKNKVKPVKRLSRQEQRKQKKEQKKQNKRLFFSSTRQSKEVLAAAASATTTNKVTKKTRGKTTDIKRRPVEEPHAAKAAATDNDDESIASDFSDAEVDSRMPLKLVKPSLPIAKKLVPARPDALVEHGRELKRQKQLKDAARKQRIKQLRVENEEDDILIHRLEKKLKLNRNKDKNRLVRKMFSTDGLDWALELCLDDDEEREKNALKQRQKEQTANAGWSEEEADSDAALSENEDAEAEEADSVADSLESEQPAVPEATLTEDIYGRKRDQQGNVLQETQKYIPPHLRASSSANGADADTEQLQRLRKQCKGLLNRLSEANLHKIATGIEQLYMQHARYHMNATLGTLLSEALITSTLCNERMLQEHMVLLAYLHAHIGSEIGAHFLQLFVEQFVAFEQQLATLPNEDKRLNNVVLLLSYMYMFRIYEQRLLLELIERLTQQLGEKAVECLLLIYQSVGLKLRKDDPLAFKQMLLNMQQRVTGAPLELQQNQRLKFMVDVLHALKNNNLHKLPQVDPQLPEQLRKRLKAMLRPDKYVVTLNIALADLLRADQVGKWWIVGSAWTGKLDDVAAAQPTAGVVSTQRYSEKLLALARAQQMNTEERRQIFCIVMSAEDFIDAYEKILHLGLKDQRSIAYVIVHCCVHERRPNPYYAHLALKFCNYNRKFQLAFQFASWDRIHELATLTKPQIRNLAQFLLQLIARGGLALSVLKVVDFVQLNKRSLLLMQEIMLGLLLWPSSGESNIGSTQIDETFRCVAKNAKLQQFKNSLRLFMQHFLLQQHEAADKQPGDSVAALQLDAEQRTLLQQRVDCVDNILAYIDL